MNVYHDFMYQHFKELFMMMFVTATPQGVNEQKHKEGANVHLMSTRKKRGQILTSKRKAQPVSKGKRTRVGRLPTLKYIKGPRFK